MIPKQLNEMNDKDEFINKKNLLQEFANEIYKFDSVGGEFQRGVDWALRMIIKHPSSDIQEVRHGEWIRKRQFVYECSLCKRIELVEGVRHDCDLKSEHKILLSMYPYCHCGAKMDGKEKTDE